MVIHRMGAALDYLLNHLPSWDRLGFVPYMPTL